MQITIPLSEQERQWCAVTLSKGVELERHGGNQGLRAAAAHYAQVRDRIGSPSRAPRLWALANVNLGAVYEELGPSNPSLIQPAIDAYMQAISVKDGLERDEMLPMFEPLARLMLQHDAQQTFANAIKWAGDIAQHPESASYRIPLITAIRNFVDHNRSLVHWAGITMALANGMRDSNDAMANNHAQAIALYRETLAKLTLQDSPPLWAALQGELGYTLSISLSGDRATNIEDAIAACGAASEVFQQGGMQGEYATSMASLCHAYLQRVHGERADNIEHGIHACTEARNARNELDHPARDELLFSLADAYMSRIQGDRAENIEYALTLLEPLTEAPRTHDDVQFRSHLYSMLGRIYLERIQGDSGENVESALAANQETARLTEPGGRNWIVARLNLAASFLRREQGSRTDNLHNGIAALESARSALSRETMPLDWANCTSNLGAAYLGLSEHSAAPEQDRAKAIEYFHQALTVRTLAEFPSDHRFIQRNLGILHFAARQWQLAWQAYHATMQAGAVLLESAYTEAGRVAEVHEDLSHFAEASYSLLQLGDFDEALHVLDRGKTRLLSQTLAMGDADLDLLPPEQSAAIHQRGRTIRSLEATLQQASSVDFAGQQLAIAAALSTERKALAEQMNACRSQQPASQSPSNVSTLTALAPRDGALIVPLTTSAGGAVFVLPAGTATVQAKHIVWLDAAATAAVSAMAESPQDKASIPATCSALWEHLMRAVVERLAALEIVNGAPLLMMPQGDLAVLPLHAAGRPVDGSMRSVIDDHPVTYAPGGYVMARCIARARDTSRARRTLLAVVNPTGDLPFAQHEGEAISSHFEAVNTTLLAGQEATVQAVLDCAHDQGFIHFSCHNHYDADDPMQSALVLADGELSIAGIGKSMDLAQVRLVTLSACETGLIDRSQSPDEFRGLATEFLQAGAPAVLSTLWPVNDLSAMLLMDRFYHLLLAEQMPIARALQSAQRWLKALTAGQIAERMGREEERLFEQGGVRLDAASRQFERFFAMPAGSRPFEHPYHSAAFVLNGA
jgi:CHAT domain-containing protein